MKIFAWIYIWNTRGIWRAWSRNFRS